MKHVRLVLSLAFAAIVLGVTALGAFWLGRIDGALAPARQMEIPMCTNGETQVRESPTGYILANVPAGAMLWFLKLDVPFAHVAYYDGSAWIKGTVPAFVLEVCDDDTD